MGEGNSDCSGNHLPNGKQEVDCAEKIPALNKTAVQKSEWSYYTWVIVRSNRVLCVKAYSALFFGGTQWIY